MMLKITLVFGGVVLIGLAIVLGFGITVYSLKEKDQDAFSYLVIPIFVLVIGMYLIVKGIRNKTTTD